MIRFHLDQHVANSVALGLRLRGVDVSTTHEAGLQDAADLAHIEYALAEERVIFTQDDDFLRHHEAGVPHAGIVTRSSVCPQTEVEYRQSLPSR